MSYVAVIKRQHEQDAYHCKPGLAQLNVRVTRITRCQRTKRLHTYKADEETKIGATTFRDDLSFGWPSSSIFDDRRALTWGRGGRKQRSLSGYMRRN
jgi:hypothetical protein